MKPEEAIEIIKIAIAEVEWDYPIDYTVAFEEAIKALEKQIPKMPIYGAANIKCPNCGATLLYYFHLFKIDYCDECGQRLDWSEEKPTKEKQYLCCDIYRGKAYFKVL